MFAGNIGKAQSVDTIVKAANILKDDNRFMFHIVGAGSELEHCKKLAEELKLKNIIFYGNKPLDEMPKMYELADVMLVTLEDQPYANTTIPCKVQSYMSVGKPIIGAINGSCSNFILNNNVGYTCHFSDSDALANLIKGLDIEELNKIGYTAKEVYYKKYSKEHFVNRLVEELNKLIRN